ncbi:MAG: ATP-binding cassette domain-containing protein [Candidatus Kaiserbacteria bacterium]|nr:ATP-binding cassette domain-containing protein [Candidatus Kaiserbacteria bacterium]MCB9816519.1 ATP-binding cassette domain-containing protein [Candidatus Nomurabacteria bacterium]
MRLNNVTLAHNGAVILKNVSIDLPPGCRLGLVGSSGAGKSTIISLLRRDLDPTAGEVLLDGQDLRGFSLRSVLPYIGGIPQTTQVLTGTVRENILHGLSRIDGVTDDAVWDVLDAVSPSFRTLFREDGLDTRVGKQGLRLSGGERQRLCVARSLIEHPQFQKRLYLIDEATSALDSETEIIVQRGIDQALDKGMSAVVVTHRLSTLRGCNRFAYLRKASDCDNNTPQVAAVCDSLGELYEYLPEFRPMADLQGISL